MTAPTGWDVPEPSDEELYEASLDALQDPANPAIRGASYGLSDYDNARRLALYEAQNVRFVNDHDEWYVWSAVRWQRATLGDRFGLAVRVIQHVIDEEVVHVDDDDARARHFAWGQQCMNESRLRSLFTVASGIDELRAQWEHFDALPLLNLVNCTLDPRTLAWHPHQRDDMLTQLCPTPYVSDATSPLLDAFLERFLPDEKERDYALQVIAVSVLSRGNDARTLVLLLGPTSTGKSTLMDLLRRTFGTDYIAAVNPSVFRGNLEDKPRPDLMRAYRTRLVLAFEASERWELHADQIKRMTGGDPLTARGMRSDVMNEMPATFVPFIVANTAPTIHGSDDALRRRLLVLAMDTPIAEDEDDGRKRAELVGDENARRALLARLVDIYHRCDGRVTLPMPPRFAEQTMELFAALDDVDYVLQQLRDGGTIHVGHEVAKSLWVTTSELHKCYRTWIDEHGSTQQKREALGLKHFGQRLRSLGHEVVRNNGMRVVGWTLGDTRIANIARF